MGFETLYMFREVEILADTDGPMTFSLSTELPGQDVAARHIIEFDTTTTTGRRPINLRMTGDVRGKLNQLRIDGPSAMRLYGVRVYAKALGIKSAWRWHNVPVVATQDGYQSAGLPILPTPEGFSTAGLPILPTPEGFAAAGLPIVPTPEGWDRQALPLLVTAPEWKWINIPVDAVE